MNYEVSRQYLLVISSKQALTSENNVQDLRGEKQHFGKKSAH